MKILLILAFSIFCCTSENEIYQKIFVIRQDGILIEKRYFDSANTVISIVTYDNDGKTPIDSTSFGYKPKKITVYDYLDGNYRLSDLSIIGDHYSHIYDHDSSCGLLKTIRFRFLLEDDIDNLCNIQNSVLPDGTVVSKKAEISTSANGVTIKYSEINTLFHDLPAIFQSYFYNQPLESFSILIKDGFLQKNTFVFSSGKLSKNYIYKNGLLKKMILTIQYSDNRGSSLEIKRTYHLQ